MKHRKIGFLLLLVFVVFTSCKRNPLKVNLSDITTEIDVVDFGSELMNLEGKDTLEAIATLSNEHTDFFNLFTYRIIRIGGIGDEDFPELIRTYLNDSLIHQVKATSDSVFSHPEQLEKQLVKAFKYYQFHFPEKELPTIYTYISGFNQSIVTAENIIGISLDKYLGRDCRYYRQLSGAPQYKVLNMHKDRILPEVAFGWGITEFEDPDAATNLLDHMVQKGKIMYLVDAMMPTLHDSLKIGYTSEQLKFCHMNEAAMWTYLIENKMLYSNKRMDVVRYINDAPTTSGFPLESPGRAGVWIGWQIVRQYMEKHPEISLPDLMANKNFQQILNESEYNPE